MIKQNFLIGLIVVPLLFSCSTIDNVSSNKKADTTVNFSFTTAQMVGGVETKATDASIVDENKIDNIWVLQFQNGNFVKKKYYNSVSPMSLDVSLASGMSDIYFMANAGQSALSSFTSDESTFKTAVKTLNAESDVLYTSVSGEKYIPMQGSLISYVVPQTGIVTNQTIILTRVLARVDVKYTVSLSNFELRTIRVCNVPQSIQYYAPQVSLFPVSPSVINTVYSSINATNGTLTFYLPENMRGMGNNTGNDPKYKSGIDYATYVELVGYTKNTDTGGDEVTYHVYPGADNYNDYNIRRNTYYTVNANINGISTSDSRLKVTPRANCYILKPGESIYIPVKRANESDLGIQLPDVTTGWAPNVEWQTATNLVNVAAVTSDQACGMFKVTAGTTLGNALVSIKNLSGKILWSWHIWVTDYDPNTTSVSFNNLIWMDRNLGATSNSPTSTDSYGLYYQWGRKDPFRTTGLVTLGTNAATTNLVNSIQNPTMWYCCPNSYDWYTNNENDINGTLWNSTKTIYDPCPAGWKIPANGSWNMLTISNFKQLNSDLGSTYTGNPPFFYPYAGFRNHTDGAFFFVGSAGHLWSSTICDRDNAYMLYLSNSDVIPDGSYLRGLGFNVRCVKE